MGWPAIYRSWVAQTRREQIRTDKIRRDRERQNEHLRKKRDELFKLRDSIIADLQNYYALGKITHAEYENLKLRRSQIGLDLILFAGKPGVSLGKRFICGEIDEIEFFKIRNNILPLEVAEEFVSLTTLLESRLQEVEKFKALCDRSRSDSCQHCGRRKSPFVWLIASYDDLVLCLLCKFQFYNLRSVPRLRANTTSFRHFTSAINP